MRRMKQNNMKNHRMKKEEGRRRTKNKKKRMNNMKDNKNKRKRDLKRKRALSVSPECFRPWGGGGGRHGFFLQASRPLF